MGLTIANLLVVRQGQRGDTRRPGGRFVPIRYRDQSRAGLKVRINYDGKKV
jgi:hypothetical protein